MFLEASSYFEYSGNSHYYQETAVSKKFKFQVVTELDVLKTHLFSNCKLADNGCWEWVGAKDGHGYGFVYRNYKSSRAHRVSYEAFIGPIPKGLVVCHSCDNPSCINPSHLRAATMKDNAADREARGRRDVKGEQVGTSKLTAEQVLEIRESDLSLKELSKIYGVDKSNIWSIRARKSWKHLEAS